GGRALVQAVDRELDAAIQVLQTLATDSSVDSGDYRRFHQRARETLQYIAADNILLIDPQLQPLAVTSREWGEPLPKLRFDRFAEALKRGQPVVSDLFVGQVSQQRQVALVVPVLRDGRTVARVEMVIGL